VFTSCASLFALGKAKGVPKQTKDYEKANGEVIVNIDNATALSNTKLCVKHGTKFRDVTVDGGEHSSSNSTLVMQFEAAAVFEMCTTLDAKCHVGLFLPADQMVEDAVDDLSTQLEEANTLVANDSSTGTCLCVLN
jgi:hypothetical protein